MNTKKGEYHDKSYFVGFSKKPYTYFTSKEKAQNIVEQYSITNFTVESMEELLMKERLKRNYDTMENEQLLASHNYYSLVVSQYTEKCITSNTVGVHSYVEYCRLKTENELLKITIELMKRKLI